MMSRNIVLFLTSCCITHLYAGDFNYNELDFPPLIIHEAKAKAPTKSIECDTFDELKRAGFEVVDECENLQSPHEVVPAKLPLVPAVPVWPTVSEFVHVVEMNLDYPDLRPTAPSSADRQAFQKAANEKAAVKAIMTAFKNMPDEITLTDEYYQIKNGRQKKYARNQYHGSYHTRLQEEARIAHILYKRTDINPARSHAETAIQQTKKQDAGAISNQPQWTLSQTAVHAKSSTPISTAPQTHNHPQIPLFQSQLALTCHILIQHWAHFTSSK